MLSVPCMAKGDDARQDSLLRERDDFVTASLLVATPGPDIYSVFGHTAIRMQCPSKGLDYCFSFEMKSDFAGYVSFFAGKARAGFLPIHTCDFMAYYAQHLRGMTQYELNLTPHEKQELWRALDSDMMEGAHRKFNLLKNNCISMSMLMIESVLEDEEIDFGKLPEPLLLNNGGILRWDTRRSPWAQFVFLSFTGTEIDNDWDMEYKVPPELIITVLKGSTIVNHTTGQRRPVLKGSAKTLLPATHEPTTSAVTPFMAFLLLLVVTLAVAIAADRWKGRWSRVAHIYGVMLFAIQTFLGVFMLYMTLASGLFGIHWNWVLIPFNPIPFLIWLFWRHRTWYPRVYAVYAVVLAGFIVVVPWLTCQLLPAHYLIVGSLAVFSWYTYRRLTYINKVKTTVKK